MMRKLLRSVARHRMVQAGMTRLNRPIKVEGNTTSRFAMNWKKYAPTRAAR